MGQEDEFKEIEKLFSKFGKIGFTLFEGWGKNRGVDKTEKTKRSVASSGCRQLKVKGEKRPNV